MSGRPKLEIVKPAVHDPEANDVEIYIDGKFIAGGSRAHHPAASLAAIEAVARHVARALGADIDVTDDPMPQPYRYFVTFAVLRTGWRAALTGWSAGQIHASYWFDLDKDVDGPADTQALADTIAERFPYPVIVTVTGVTYVDGPC